MITRWRERSWRTPASRAPCVGPAEAVQAAKGKGAQRHACGDHILDRVAPPAARAQRRRLRPRGSCRTPSNGAGNTVVTLGNDQQACGLIVLADAPRPEARAVVQALRRQGVGHLVMLTGDNTATANAIAAGTGVDDVRAELLPEDKVAAMDELVERFGTVAMVGDGVNDAPAMARSSFGVAMGADGQRCRDRDGGHRAHGRRSHPSALAGRAFPSRARHHPPEHRLFHCRQGRVRRAHVRRAGDALGRDPGRCRRHAAGGVQRAAPAAGRTRRCRNGWCIGGRRGVREIAGVEA
ncbi:MAG: HAD-IC family P-type ATPase [Halofilum sp. (in: g-proteobacteria)]|nr:HAD-IC family P-type ATPase [Halofilum sp. (in: g-proteobacteria)]